MAKKTKAEVRELVFSTIRTFASSQGFYGRLLNTLNEADEQDVDAWLTQFEDCNDTLDVVMQIEC